MGAGPLSAIHMEDKKILLDGQVFHSFDQPSLDVACAGSLDSRVDETFSASHGMEEQLLGSEPSEVGVLHEAARLRPQVILGEVGQRAAGEAKWNPLALHILLAHTSNHLQDKGTLPRRGSQMA